MILLIFILVSFTACSKNVDTISCCNIINTYKMYDYNTSNIKPIDVARGYERIAKILFIDKKVNEFRIKVKKYLNSIYYTRNVNNPYINSYCLKAKKISKENNNTKIDQDLYYLESEWVKSYKNNLTKNLKGKFKFNKLDGCDSEADSFEKVFFDRRGTHTMSNEHYINIRNIYNNCLAIVKSKKEKAEINKLKKGIVK